MNKKIKNLFLAGALVLGLAGVAVSCTDYDDDIQKLQGDITNVTGQVSNLQQTVQNLQNAINAGSVITSVTAISGEPGGWKFTTSDGKSYDVLNGAKGANGAAGKDGVYYTPNPETGCWDLHDGSTVTNTGQSYLPGGAVAYDAEKGVLVVKDGDETVEIKLSAGETGLVFIPQCYIDGVEGVIGGVFRYNPYELAKDAKLDSKTEAWSIKQEKDENGRFVDVVNEVSIPIEAQYHVNVSDFELDNTFEYEFVCEDVPYYMTRVESSKDFSITPTFKSYENGVLTVTIVMTGTPAEDEDITRFALKVTKDGKSIVSDYATIFSELWESPKIADPKAVVKECKPSVPNYDEHYRRYIATADGGDAYLPTQLVWSEGHTSLADAHATCDTAVVYDGSLDLKTITAVHYALRHAAATGTSDAEMNAEIFEKVGLKFVYEVVKNYKIGTPVTDQADFVTLKDGVFTPRTYDTDGTAAIGRTPIVRVKLMVGEDIAAVAYIKVFISKDDPIGPKFTLLPVDKDGKNVFKFACDGDKLTTTVPDMNTVLYNGTNKSKNEFHALYTNWKVTDKNPIGNVADVVVSPAEGTHVLEWTVPVDSLWKYAGKEIEINGRYYNPTEEANGIYVDVKLTASVADLAKEFNLDPAKGDYIAEYWTENFAATKYNVVTPSLKDTLAADAAKCVFKNNINASFVTYSEGPNAGLVKIYKDLTDIQYFFCNPDAKVKDEGMVAVKNIGTLNVKFEIKADGTELWAAIMKADKPTEVAVASELVAKITNNTAGPDWNIFEYQKGTTVADTLLNTGKMFVYIGAKATMCNDAKKQVTITFNGENHFQANIIQPVTIATKSKDGFVDAVDFGEEGSYIKIEDLLDPVDWRGRKFSEGPGKLHLGYWNYYGPFDVKIDIASAECDLNGKRQAVPVTIILNQTPGAETGTIAVTDPVTGGVVNLPANKGGYLTYKNNGTVVTGDFHIYVKAKVGYGFGYIDTEWIEIPVAKTIGQ